MEWKSMGWEESIEVWKNAEIMGKKIGTAAVPAVPKGSMESINFLGGPARVASGRYEYEKAFLFQVTLETKACYPFG